MKTNSDIRRAALAGNLGKMRAPAGMPRNGVVNNGIPATILNHVGDAWRCSRLPHETDRAFAFRLGVHLQTLAIAIEEDLACVRKAERNPTEER
jgi:hypothetical protein